MLTSSTSDLMRPQKENSAERKRLLPLQKILQSVHSESHVRAMHAYEFICLLSREFIHSFNFCFFFLTCDVLFNTYYTYEY